MVLPIGGVTELFLRVRIRLKLLVVYLGIKDCFVVEKRPSKAAYLRGGGLAKLVSPQRANFQLRSDLYKGIVHRSSFRFILLFFLRRDLYATTVISKAGIHGATSCRFVAWFRKPSVN